MTLNGRKNICIMIGRRFIAQNLKAKFTKLRGRHNLRTDLLLNSLVVPDFPGQQTGIYLGMQKILTLSVPCKNN